MEFILILFLLFFGWAWASDIENRQEKIDSLCTDLLNEQTTLVDSLSVAQKYEDCLWFEDDDSNNE